MASLVEFERSLCKNCGQPLDESTDPMRSFEIERDHVCFADQELARVAKELQRMHDPKGEHPEEMAGRRPYIVRSRRWDDDDVAKYMTSQLMVEGGHDGAERDSGDSRRLDGPVRPADVGGGEGDAALRGATETGPARAG